MIALTSLYLIRSNRQLFARLASLSSERRELAQQLIATRESTLREISRELHDEFGQVLTAMGSMLGRAGRHAPEGSPLRAELREIGEIAQTTLDNVRGLSQTLHPSILDDAGLERTVDWYLSTVERQLGVAVSYERPAVPLPALSGEIGIHVYRVLQESLSNVARHSGVEAGHRSSACLAAASSSSTSKITDRVSPAHQLAVASASWPCASARRSWAARSSFCVPRRRRHSRSHDSAR